ncbi:hypothetical protein ACFE04_001153 [Oxalis oulophora]
MSTNSVTVVTATTTTTPKTESTHYRLYEFVKIALIRIFAHPYATVCDLYYGGGVDFDKWDGAQFCHYIGIDASSSGIDEIKEGWESHKKNYTAEFFQADPSVDTLETKLPEKAGQADMVCCLQHLQLFFETEDKARKLLSNVSALLKPGGYFFGITPDSSTIWAKYQKNVEACHNRGSGMKPNIMPNCIRSENYTITFEVEEEKFPFFGKKYQLKFASDISAETHCLVHFPSFIRLAREADLEYMEIQNLNEFYDDNKAQFTSMMANSGPNLVDTRGRLLPRSHDLLGLYTTFIFRKHDPDIVPPLSTPLVQEEAYTPDEILEWQGQGVVWAEDEINVALDPSQGLGKIVEQKGILGPGPPDLRFSETVG